MIARREPWRDDLTLVRRLHTHVLQAERILAGDALTAAGVPISNATVGQQFDQWCAGLRDRLGDVTLAEPEQRCLQHFLHVTTNMRSRLIHCYDVVGMPRTNNDMEGFIRSIKTRYRRISGRKNWNRYLIRYGARVAYYEARARAGDLGSVAVAIRQLPAAPWRRGRAEQTARQQEQLKQHRVRHRRDDYLAELEARWSALEIGT